MVSARILVLADDLTGATDAGVQFAGAGIRSIVLTDHDIAELPLSYPAIVINTESRHITAKEAAARIRHGVEVGLEAGVSCFYKKTDSTLRGNIAAELEALLVATNSAFVPFVPALPDLGRTTVRGEHYVHGKRISETAFARDPLNPIRQSRVAEVLNSTTRIAICELGPHDKAAAGFRGIGVIDCQSNSDLTAIAQTHGGLEGVQLFAGSVALLPYLLEQLKVDSPRPAVAEPLPPVLLVNGSLNERSLTQIQNAGPSFSRLKLTPEQLVGDSASLVIPAGGGHLLLQSISELSELEAFRQWGAACGLTDAELHFRVAERMGRLVHEILAAGVFRSLVVFGGDTLAAVARANHWGSFEPLGEIEPGLSVSQPVGGDITLISKSGGFGPVDVIRRIVNWVERS